MKGVPINSTRLKSIRVGRLGRTALMLGVAGATVGSLVLGAGVANAWVGTDPGEVALTPASGPTSGTPTWETTAGCASGYQGSAVLKVVETQASGSTAADTASISTADNGTAAAFGGSLQASLSTIMSIYGLSGGSTYELVVICYSAQSETGNQSPEMDEWITFSADGSSYTTSATAPSQPSNPATSTTLTASPATATAGSPETLTATVTDADGSTPAGSVAFMNGASTLGTSNVTNGVATFQTTFASAGTESLSAVYTPTSSSYNSSTGTLSLTVSAAPPNSGTEPIAVTVPASGTFTLTVAAGTVNLAVSGATATGALNPITVSDTRNTYPGWSVTGQVANFVGSGTAASGNIPGDQLGWVPTDTSLATGAVLGATVTPGSSSPGLGDTAEVLASAVPGGGNGTSALGANLTLDIPATAPAGPYTSSLTVTGVTTGP
jgi:hypothetical protein